MAICKSAIDNKHTYATELRIMCPCRNKLHLPKPKYAQCAVHMHHRYALVSSVNTPMVWSPLALAPGLGPSIRLKTTSHPSSLIFPLFPHFFLMNLNCKCHRTYRMKGTCNDYPYQPSITPHSHHRSTWGGGVPTIIP